MSNDDNLRHNYLERKRRDEVLAPTDTLGAQKRTAARLSALFDPAPSPGTDLEQRVRPEPCHSRAQVVDALVACDVDAEKIDQVIHVLRSLARDAA